jgi:hypothetical protein
VALTNSENVKKDFEAKELKLLGWRKEKKE